MVIVESGGGNELTKSGRRDVFFRGCYRSNDRCVYRSAVVCEEAWRRRGPRQRSEATWYYYLLFLPGMGVQNTTEVAEANATS